MRLTILFIHGIGTQDSNYPQVARSVLAEELYKHGHRFSAHTVHWAPVLDKPERILLEKVDKLGGDNGPLRRLAVSTLTDALVYQADSAIVESIHKRITYALREASDTTPLIVCAHSLGGLIFSDYLRSHNLPELERLSAFVTFGCNLPLFSLTKPFHVPPLGGARWLNFWDPDDCLGFPLKVLPNLENHVEDIPVNVGSLFTWWNGLAHTGYWDDKKFWRLVSKRLSAGLPRS